MAYFTLEIYSPAMGRDALVTVIQPTHEITVGSTARERFYCKDCRPAEFDGIWLLPRPGGLPTDWLRLTRHVENGSGRFMVIMPPSLDCEGYDEFLTRELPAFLSGCGLRAGAEHNVIGAHPENQAAAERLQREYPEVFGEVLCQAECVEGGWRQANKTIMDYYARELGVEAVQK